MIRHLHSRRWVAKCFPKWLDDCENKKYLFMVHLENCFSVFPVSCTKIPLCAPWQKFLIIFGGCEKGWEGGNLDSQDSAIEFVLQHCTNGTRVPSGWAGLVASHHWFWEHTQQRWMDTCHILNLFRPCNTSCCSILYDLQLHPAFRTVLQNILWK